MDVGDFSSDIIDEFRTQQLRDSLGTVFADQVTESYDVRWAKAILSSAPDRS